MPLEVKFILINQYFSSVQYPPKFSNFILKTNGGKKVVKECLRDYIQEIDRLNEKIREINVQNNVMYLQLDGIGVSKELGGRFHEKINQIWHEQSNKYKLHFYVNIQKYLFKKSISLIKNKFQ